MANRQTSVLERNRLADFGYYASIGIGFSDLSRHSRVAACTQSEHEDAVARYQAFYQIALNLEARDVYGRDINVDGIFGDVCGDELAKARCGEADQFTERERASQSNWPEACRHQLTTSHKPGMTLPGLSLTEVQAMIDKSARNWMSVLDIRINRIDDWPNTHIYIEPVRLHGSTLADQYLANGSCSYRSQGRMDNDRWWDRKMACGTRAHEDGHALGLRHSSNPRALMYAQMTQHSMDSFGMPTESDVVSALSIGYSRAESPEPTPPPEPPEQELDTQVVITRSSGEVITIRGREV